MQQLNKDDVLVLDQQLKMVEKRKFSSPGITAWLDVDNDGQKEFILFNSQQSKLCILRSNLQDMISIDLPFIIKGLPSFSVKLNGKETPELFIWDHSATALFTYHKNQFFYWKWAIYIGIYLGILLFTWLIRRLQLYQIEQKRLIEKKITELQMKIVKNQLDPHFTLNAVNSIIYAVNNNEPQRASEHLFHFSNLYRHLLLTADQFTCSLKDELNFTTDYLKMAQLRHRDKFGYSIEIDPKVNQETEVPKMCIQSAVENAVKHGIAPLANKGEIQIDIRNQQDNLLIEVTDNGVGRETAAENNQTSTGMGTKLTRQYFELFTKITKQKVDFEIMDLKSADEKPLGTKVRIIIQLN